MLLLVLPLGTVHIHPSSSPGSERLTSATLTFRILNKLPPLNKFTYADEANHSHFTLCFLQYVLVINLVGGHSRICLFRGEGASNLSGRFGFGFGIRDAAVSSLSEAYSVIKMLCSLLPLPAEGDVFGSLFSYMGLTEKFKLSEITKTFSAARLSASLCIMTSRN